MTTIDETTRTSPEGAAPISAWNPADWRVVPKGSYAVPIYDWIKFGDECTGETTPPLDLLGYKLFERKVSRQFRTGRTVGRDEFITGTQFVAAGAAERNGVTPWQRLKQELASDRFVAEHDMCFDGSRPRCLCFECERKVRELGDSASGYWVREPSGSYAACAAAAILHDIEHGDTYRAKFGQLTGKCGRCLRLLTDPKSKLLGIGPECRRYL